MSLFSRFTAVVSDTLLFLNHITSVEIHQGIKEGKEIPMVKANLKLDPQNLKFHRFRNSLVEFCKNPEFVTKQEVVNVMTPTQNKGKKKRGKGNQPAQPLSVMKTTECIPSELLDKSYTESWAISHIVHEKKLKENLKDLSTLKHLPMATVAGCLNRKTPIDGRLYCGLPVQGKSLLFLPVHVNAYIMDFTMPDQDWNLCILHHVVVEAYLKLIQNCASLVQSTQLSLSLFYRYLWPKLDRNSSSVWSQVTRILYEALRTTPCLPRPWLNNVPRNSDPILIPKNGILSSFEQKKNDLTEKVEELLKTNSELDFPLFQTYNFVIEGLQPVERLSPSSVRDFFKNRYSSVSCWPSYETSPFKNFLCVEKILEYCLSEIYFPNDLNMPLCGMVGGKITWFGSGDKKFWANEEELELLPGCTNFIDPKIIDVFIRQGKDFRLNQIGVLSMTVFDLTENLDVVLPRSWKYKPIVKWSPIDPCDNNSDSSDHQVSLIWLKRLWRYIGPNANEINSQWPIIPTTDGHLISKAHASKFLFLDDIETRKFKKIQIEAILSLLGIFFPMTDVIPVGYIRSFCPKSSAIEILKLFSYPTYLEKAVTLPPHHRDFLLKWFIDEIPLNIIKENASIISQLPFFETEAPALPDFLVNICAMFVWKHKDHPSIAKKIISLPDLAGQLDQFAATRYTTAVKAFILPSEVPVTQVNQTFIKYKENLMPLYKAVGINILNVMAFIKSFVIPEFSSLDLEEQDRLIYYIKEKKMHTDVVFSENLRRWPFLDTQKVKRTQKKCPRELYNPKVPVFQYLFKDEEGALFPHKRFLKDSSWIEFLCTLGLQNEPTRDHIMACVCSGEAKMMELQLDPLSNRDINIAYSFIEYLVRTFNINPEKNTKTSKREDLENAQDMELLKKLGTFAFFPSYWDKRLGKLVDVKFSSARDTLLPSYRHLVWTQRPLLEPKVKLPDYFCLMWNFTEPSVELVYQHLEYLITQGRKYLTPESPLKDELNYIWEFFYLQFRTHPYNFKKVLEGKFQNLACFLVEDRVLVKANQLFFKLPHDDLRPYFFEVPRNLMRFEWLLKWAGAHETPTISDLCGLLKKIKLESGHQMLNPNQLRCVVRTLKLLSKSKMTIDTNSIYFPNQKLVLKPTNLVYYRDINVLDRIDSSLLDLVHINIPKKVAQALGVRLVSQVISESIVEENLSLSDNIPMWVTTCNKIIQSEKFSEALLRILYHEREIATILPQKIVEKIQSISKFVIVPVKEIFSSFKNLETNQDITIEKTGTMCLIQPDKKKLYLVVDQVPVIFQFQDLVAQQLNHFLGDIIKDLLPLRIMLTVYEPNEIESTLDLIGVSKATYERTCQISDTTNIIWDIERMATDGQTLSVFHQSLLNPDPITTGALVDREIVAYRGCDSQLCYGSIKARLTDNQNFNWYELENEIVVSGADLYKFGNVKLMDTKVALEEIEVMFNEMTRCKQLGSHGDMDRERKIVIKRLKEVWKDYLFMLEKISHID